MITYFLNFMGPISHDWIANNGLSWSGGRIDVDGTDNPYGEEIGVPIMRTEDWDAFGAWLYELQTENVWTLERLVEHFQYWYKKEIRWYNKKEIRWYK